MRSFGDELRQLREKRGLSQSRLAALSGLSASYIAMVETNQRGRRPARAAIAQLAQGLDVPVDRLLKPAGLAVVEPVEPMVVSVPAAIEADDSLGERERQLLLDLYDLLQRRPVHKTVHEPARKRRVADQRTRKV